MNSKSRYKYYNRNPWQEETEDCVCRAISTATGLNYEAINNLLELTAYNFGCDKLCVCCYNNLLEKVLCYQKISCTNGETVEDIAREFPQDKMIIRIEGHLTSSIKGTILDIWDCGLKKVDCFWIVY